MNHKVDVHEARIRLLELLRAVQTGRRFTITCRGEAIAELIPLATRGVQDVERAVQEIEEFMIAAPTRGVDIRALLNEGRR